MSSKRKFKRDYIILEAKDMNFRSKERVLPKAFAKIEINEEKSIIALYVENLKNMKDGYDVAILRNDYEKIDLGKINLNSQGKGEFVLDLDEENSDIKAVALIYDKYIPLIGFKGSKVDNYEELLLDQEPDEEYIDEYVDDNDEYEYEEVEYIYDDDMQNDTNEQGSSDIPIEDEQSGYDYEEVEYEYYEVDEDEYTDEEGNDDDNTYEEYEYYEDNIMEQDNNSNENRERNTSKYSGEKNSTYIKNEKENKHKSSNKNSTKKHTITKKQERVNDKKIVRDEFNNELDFEADKKVTGTLLMPRQIKKGLKYFKEVKPFASDYITNTRWWKIDINPTTMCGYNMPYLGYVNSLNYTMYSDTAMNSYKYRHYLFGVQYDEYNKRKYYIYAVPGKKSEQPDKGSTGFTSYQPCDNRNNSLGYWLCFIDSRARKIVK